MNENLKPLFSKWHIGNVEIKNRVVMTSMGGTNILGWMEINHFDKEASKFLKKVSENNVGLILPGCQPVYNPMFGQWLHKKKGMYKKLKPFMDEIHKTGAKLFVQLTAGFGRSFTVSPMMEKLYTNKFLRFLSKPVMDLDKITASASSAPNRWSDKIPSREMTIKEIHKFIESFAKTAKLLKENGVDGVEVHAVHEGYLLDQFTLKYVNNRTDEYGGSFENRYRFPVEIVKAIKKECGEDFPVSLRFSVISKTKGFREGALPGENYHEVGRDLDEAIKAAKYLQDAGYDMLNCDNGTYDAWYWAHPPIYMEENCNLEDVSKIKKYIDIPIVVAGRMDPFVGSKAIEENKVDAIGFARPFLADQEWVTKLINEDYKHIRPCICCHNGCFNMAHYQGVPSDQDLSDSLHLSRCAVNAETMQTNKHYIEKTKHPENVAIIGAGIGGMEAARVLTLRGHKVKIYEKSDRFGGVFNEASNESYKGKLKELLAWYILTMKDMHIDVEFNREITDLKDIDADAYVIATGSKARKLKIKGIEDSLEAIEYLQGKEVGDNVLVVGGGLTGSEIAYELHLKGKHPSIIEMKNDIIAQKGVCLANSSYLRDYFKLHEVPIYLNSKLVAIDKENKLATIQSVQDDNTKKLTYDSIIISAGYIETPLVPKGKNVYLVGDCLKVGNLRDVIWRAYDVAMKI